MKKHELTELIREIVSRIVKEIKIEEESACAAVAPVTGKVIRKESPMEEEMDDQISETVTGDVSGYNVPSWVSKKGGSAAGVAGSRTLGYELTPIGQKDMQRVADAK